MLRSVGWPLRSHLSLGEETILHLALSIDVSHRSVMSEEPDVEPGGRKSQSSMMSAAGPNILERRHRVQRSALRLAFACNQEV